MGVLWELRTRCFGREGEKQVMNVDEESTEELIRQNSDWHLAGYEGEENVTL